jgi:hypothetical protein
LVLVVPQRQPLTMDITSAEREANYRLHTLLAKVNELQAAFGDPLQLLHNPNLDWHVTRAISERHVTLFKNDSSLNCDRNRQLFVLKMNHCLTQEHAYGQDIRTLWPSSQHAATTGDD